MIIKPIVLRLLCLACFWPFSNGFCIIKLVLRYNFGRYEFCIERKKKLNCSFIYLKFKWQPRSANLWPRFRIYCDWTVERSPPPSDLSSRNCCSASRLTRCCSSDGAHDAPSTSNTPASTWSDSSSATFSWTPPWIRGWSRRRWAGSEPSWSSRPRTRGSQPKAGCSTLSVRRLLLLRTWNENNWFVIKYGG